MPEDLIRYDILAQEALRGVIKKVIGEVAVTGLPGEHHFYVTFRTKAPGVRISTRLLEKYPEEMTIVLQHEYRDLTVTDSAVEVSLSFGAIPERLLIPFAAIRTFIDPSVQFALQFDPQPAEAGAESPDLDVEAEPEMPAFLADQPAQPSLPKPSMTRLEPAKAAADTAAAKSKSRPEAAPASGAAEVVSLDAFRKKN